MQLSNKAKIALGLAVILIIAVVFVYLNSRKSDNVTLPSESPITDSSPIDGFFTEQPGADNSAGAGLPIGDLVSPTSSDSADTLESKTPGATQSGTSTLTTPSTARTPVSTVDQNGVRWYKVTITPAPNAGPLDWTVTNNELTIVDTRNSPYNNKTVCEMAGLSSSWSNSIEKMTCDATNFITTKIMEPLAQLACSFHASALQTNYNNDLKYEYKGGACLIIDRK